ncbi:MAG: thioredoxin domain-containing protein [Hydrogenimonas sp.]|nr:thioredoxin domain-containing protein [Hydrogenimonas sp.]
MRYFISTIFILASFIYGGGTREYTNRLIDEDSPYLQQHAHNPVDWYPWGEEAFEKAKREHKPIFLSIGYSTCHWCHVMEEESFENEEIAELINRYFIPVKVDRERMPHLDRHFQRIYSILNRRGGGWPLTIFLTEDLKPFFAATYIPPEDSYGVKGMKTLVPAIGRLYSSNREVLIKRAEAVEVLVKRAEVLPSGELKEGVKIADRAVEAIWSYYDKLYGGFGDRPKFPESSRISLLLDIYRLNGDEKAKMMALQTLDAMQRSGLYDQIEGAFFRYCVDRGWRMPHFEKMLYTNAELIPLYVEAWKITENKRFREIVEETIAEIDRRFRTQEGLYFSASDADSEGEEGGYFLYRYDEAFEALQSAGFKKERAENVLHFLDISEDGNFDTEYSHARRISGKPPADLSEAVEILKKMRESRSYPFVDRKIITAWNAMMIKALFIASRVDPKYLKEAKNSYRSLLKLMSSGSGELYHQVLYGKRPKQNGLLEDYAFFADAALTAYETTLEQAYLNDAVLFVQKAKKGFYKKGRWVLGEEGDIVSYADISDSYYSSPLSVMINNLITLAVLKGSFEELSLARKTLEGFATFIKESPDAYPTALKAYLRLEKGVVAIKSSRENLQKKAAQIEKIRYPYLLREAQDGESWMACDFVSCFAYGRDFEKVAEAIEKRGL